MPTQNTEPYDSDDDLYEDNSRGSSSTIDPPRAYITRRGPVNPIQSQLPNYSSIQPNHTPNGSTLSAATRSDPGRPNKKRRVDTPPGTPLLGGTSRHDAIDVDLLDQGGIRPGPLLVSTSREIVPANSLVSSIRALGDSTTVPRNKQQLDARLERRIANLPKSTARLAVAFKVPTGDAHEQALKRNMAFDFRPNNQDTLDRKARALQIWDFWLTQNHAQVPVDASGYPGHEYFKTFTEDLAMRYISPHTGRPLTLDTIAHVVVDLFDALHRKNKRIVPEDTRVQVTRFISGLKDDPRCVDNNRARRRLPVLDVQDARAQLQALLHPTKFFVSPNIGPRRRNSDRIQLALSISIMLYSGLRIGSLYKTAGLHTAQTEWLTWRDVDIERWRQDRFGWAWILRLRAKWIKNGKNDPSKFVNVLMRSPTTPEGLVLDAPVLLIALGLRRGVFKKYPDAASIESGDIKVLEIKDEFLDKPVFLRPDGVAMDGSRALVMFQELLWLLGYRLHLPGGSAHKLTFTCYRYNFNATLKNDPTVHDVDRGAAMGWNHQATPEGDVTEHVVDPRLDTIYDSDIRLDVVGIMDDNEEVDKNMLRDQRSGSHDRVDPDVLKAMPCLVKPISWVSAKMAYQATTDVLTKPPFNYRVKDLLVTLLEDSLSQEPRDALRAYFDAKNWFYRENQAYEKADQQAKHAFVLRHARRHTDGSDFYDMKEVITAVQDDPAFAPSAPDLVAMQTTRRRVGSSHGVLQLNTLLALIPAGIALPGGTPSRPRMYAHAPMDDEDEDDSDVYGTLSEDGASTSADISEPESTAQAEDLELLEVEGLTNLRAAIVKRHVGLAPSSVPVDPSQPISAYLAPVSQGIIFDEHIPEFLGIVPRARARMYMMSLYSTMPDQTEPFVGTKAMVCGPCHSRPIPCPSASTKEQSQDAEARSKVWPTQKQLDRHIEQVHAPQELAEQYAAEHALVCPYCLVWTLAELSSLGLVAVDDIPGHAITPRNVTAVHWEEACSAARKRGLTSGFVSTVDKRVLCDQHSVVDYKESLLGAPHTRAGEPFAPPVFDFSHYLSPAAEKQRSANFQHLYAHILRHFIVLGGVCPMCPDAAPFLNFDHILLHFEDHGFFLYFAGAPKRFSKCCNDTLTSYRHADDHARDVHLAAMQRGPLNHPQRLVMPGPGQFIVCGWCAATTTLPDYWRYFARSATGNSHRPHVEQHIDKMGDSAVCFCDYSCGTSDALRDHLLLAHGYPHATKCVLNGQLQNKSGPEGGLGKKKKNTPRKGKQ